jgi:pimeloyl-ACP methyl ester carboxylesterase/DNA-binding CsgD family transcriptional regulator
METKAVTVRKCTRAVCGPWPQGGSRRGRRSAICGAAVPSCAGTLRCDPCNEGWPPTHRIVKNGDATAAAMPVQTQQIRFARSHDGVRLAYAASGRGHTLVKAATWLSHLEYDWESPVWRHVLQELSARYQLVRYDERGCGLSDWRVPELTFDSWVRDLETVVDAVGAERFALLGISQGASIAIAYAVKHPERVTHLVLHGAYARGRLVRSHTPQQVEEAEMMCRLAEIGWGKADPSFRQFFTTQFIPGGTPQQHEWFNELERMSTSPANAAAFMRAFNTIDVTPLLPRVRCPTLVLHSTRDVRVPFEEGRLVAMGVPGAQFVPLESGNHLLLDTEPAWRRALAEVEAFLPLGRAPGAEPRIAGLSPRLLGLLELMAQGRDNAQIAAVLGLSEKTVRNHITVLFDRLQVDSRAQAIVLARDNGLGKGSA